MQESSQAPEHDIVGQLFPNPDIKGVLNKWTNYIDGWQPRFVVLQDGNLSYYKGPECRGEKSLFRATIKPHEFEECKFDVSDDDSVWYLRADSIEDKQRWVEVLEAFKDRTRGGFPWRVTAQEEFERNPNLKPEDLDSLRTWIRSQSHLPQNVEDEMLLHFLHACYFHVDDTKSKIEHNYSYKTQMTEFFADWDPLSKETQEIVNNVLIAAPLPGVDEEGNKVIVCKLNDTVAANFNYPICVKWLLMTTQVAQWDEGIQSGYITVFDASGFSMSHLYKCSLGTIKNYINWGKNAWQIRSLKLIFINTNPVVKRLLTLTKPFLDEDLLSMIELHPDSDTYFETMSKDNVPEDYGGTAAPILSLHRDYMKRIIEHRLHLIEDEKQKSDELKRAGISAFLWNMYMTVTSLLNNRFVRKRLGW